METAASPALSEIKFLMSLEKGSKKLPQTTPIPSSHPGFFPNVRGDSAKRPMASRGNSSSVSTLPTIPSQESMDRHGRKPQTSPTRRRGGGDKNKRRTSHGSPVRGGSPPRASNFMRHSASASVVRHGSSRNKNLPFVARLGSLKGQHGRTSHNNKKTKKKATSGGPGSSSPTAGRKAKGLRRRAAAQAVVAERSGQQQKRKVRRASTATSDGDDDEPHLYGRKVRNMEKMVSVYTSGLQAPPHPGARKRNGMRRRRKGKGKGKGNGKGKKKSKTRHGGGGRKGVRRGVQDYESHHHDTAPEALLQPVRSMHRMSGSAAWHDGHGLYGRSHAASLPSQPESVLEDAHSESGREDEVPATNTAAEIHGAKGDDAAHQCGGVGRDTAEDGPGSTSSVSMPVGRTSRKGKSTLMDDPIEDPGQTGSSTTGAAAKHSPDPVHLDDDRKHNYDSNDSSDAGVGAGAGAGADANAGANADADAATDADADAAADAAAGVAAGAHVDAGKGVGGSQTQEPGATPPSRMGDGESSSKHDGAVPVVHHDDDAADDDEYGSDYSDHYNDSDHDEDEEHDGKGGAASESRAAVPSTPDATSSTADPLSALPKDLRSPANPLHRVATWGTTASGDTDYDDDDFED